MIQYEAVASTAKGTGKAHRARLVRATDMHAALTTIEAVRANRMEPPAWYDKVTCADRCAHERAA